MTFMDEIRNAAVTAAANTASVSSNAGAISANTLQDSTRHSALLEMIGLLEQTLLDMIRESSFKLPINVATDANIDLTVALEPGQAVDGVTLLAGFRVLVKDQTDAKQNGVYEVKATGGPIRAVDCDEAGEICCAFFSVVGGTTNGGKLFQCTNKTCVVGTDDITIVLREFAA